MPRTTIAKQVPKGPFPGTVAADALDIALVAGDQPNGHDFAPTGKELLIAYNTGAGARTITLTSTQHSQTKRTGDITTYSIGAGEMMAFSYYGGNDGWQQTGDSKIYIDVSHAEVKLAILTLP